MTTDVLDAKDLFLSHYRDFQKRYGRADDGLAALRGSAMERFGDLGLPSQRDENWRFTPLTALADTPFQLADHSADDLDTAEFERLLPATGPAVKIVLVNGRYVPRFSKPTGLPEGVFVGSLGAALDGWRERAAPHLAKVAHWDKAPFVALN